MQNEHTDAQTRAQDDARSNSENKKRRRLPRASRRKVREIDPTRIGQLLRLALSTDQDGEALAAIGALKRALAAGGRDLHDLAAVVEAGLQPQPQQQRQRQSWGPPSPSPHDWAAMSWYLHYHRIHLRKDQAEFVADMLFGQGDGFDEGRIRNWAIRDLQAMVRHVRAATRSTSTEVRR